MYYPVPTKSDHEAAPRAAEVAGTFHVHRLFGSLFHDLRAATAIEGIIAALSAVGARVGMPHVDVFTTRLDGAVRQIEELRRSEGAPQAVIRELRSHPLFMWAAEAQVPIFVSEADEKLVFRHVQRSAELAGFDGLLVNIPLAPDRSRHFGFFGEHGVANGLSRTLLFMAAQLAHERLSSPPTMSALVPAPVPATASERNVLELALMGLNDREIARALGIAPRTVRFHIVSLRRKFGAESRTALIASIAQRTGAAGR